MTHEELKLGIEFLVKVKNDYQFNKESQDYLGFLNCGDDITDDPGYMIIVDNAEEFILIMDDMGISTESGIRADETIFVLINN